MLYLDRDRGRQQQKLTKSINYDLQKTYNSSKQQENGIWWLLSGVGLIGISAPFFATKDNIAPALFFSSTGLVVATSGGILLARAKNS